jgi:isoleucyl-tRNA synthetase
VAVNPGVTYVAARAGDEVLVVAEPLLACSARTRRSSSASPARRSSTRRTRGRSTWSRSRARTSWASRTTSRPTAAPAWCTSPPRSAPTTCSSPSATACRGQPGRPDGTFEEHLPLVGGQFFKAADAALVADLRERGLLFREQPYEHSYPHCWRCDTALLYYALPSWYVRTTAVKDRLLEENERTTWYPSTIKHGRYGDWLENNIDWALSRNRYWGTPLPVWRCTADAAHWQAYGSLAELGEDAGQELSALDPHRPYVDDVVVPCRSCGRRPGACRRSSTAGTTPAPCRSRRSATRTRASSRPTRRSSSARRSTRPAAGSTRS